MRWLCVIFIIQFILFLGCKQENKNDVRPSDMDSYRKYRDTSEVSKQEYYLKKINRYDEYLSLKNRLMKEGFYEGEAESFSLYTILNGVSLTELEYLKSKGYDYIRRLKKGLLIFGEKIFLWESAISAELVIIGKVKRIDYYPKYREPGDGYYQSVIIEVEELLVGKQNCDSIVLRQFSSYPGSGIWSSGDIKFSPGDIYLFMLSNGVYRYYTDVELGGKFGPSNLEYPENMRRCFYVKVEVPHKLINGKLEYPIGPSFIPTDISDTEKILNEIRKIGKLRKEFEEKVKGR